MTKFSRADSRGFVLLVALGVLGVLGLLAATFATLSRVERAVSNSYVDKVRAKMLAQSGVERAIASIRGRAMVQSWDDVRNDWFYREMINAEAGALTYPPVVKSDIWKFTPTRAYGMPPRSLESALDDGLVNGVANGISFPQSIDPKNNEPFSGQFAGTYENRGDVYALKVLDCASMLNVNDGGKNVQRMLNNLGGILKCADGTMLNLGGFALGDEIVKAAIKRAKPFNNKSEVFDAVFLNNPGYFVGNSAEARKRFNACKEFITCHGWVDGMTMKFENTWDGASDYSGGSWASAVASFSQPAAGPVYAAAPAMEKTVGSAQDPADTSKSSSTVAMGYSNSPLYSISASMPGTYASLPSSRLLAAPPVFMVKDVKKGGGFKQFVTGQGATVATGGEYAAGKFGGTYYYGEPRTPVNINTASREVIVATLMNLEASFWDYEWLPGGSQPQFSGSMVLLSVKITQPDAEKIADYLISQRFTNGTPAGAWSYNDWMHFEDDVILSIPGITKYQRALVKANANPNTNVKKLDPDLILVTSNPSVNPQDLVRMDKSDVNVNSTEWTFSSNGIFEIEAIGRVYNAGKVMAEEKVETVVKVFDQVVYTTQEQFEKDRVWTTEDSKEGDLLAGGYPPVVSMPEYVYNVKSNPIHYRSQTGDVSWCADYEGYMILNGPAKVQAGTSPGPARDGDSSGTNNNAACWGPDPSAIKIKGTPPAPPDSLLQACGVSFVAGFNLGSVYPNQSHRNAWHDAAGGFGSPGGGPRHPEYAYSSPHCFNDGISMSANPAQSFYQDTGYASGYSTATTKPYQIEPTAAASGWSWGSSGGIGANFWDNGTDLQNFGIYINETRRNRFHTYWADEVPAPNCTIEMTVKPENDIKNWVTSSRQHVVTSSWSGSYTILACKKQFFFDWGVGSTKNMNYSVRAYAETARVYLEMYHHPTGKFYVIWVDQNWKAHTWHHVEFTWVCGQEITKADGSKVIVPPNAMVFADGTCNTPGESSMSSPAGAGSKDVNTLMGMSIYGGAAICLPENVKPTNPNNDVGTGPRFDVGGILANDGSFGMSSPRWHGVIDNIVMHHWRSHDAPFSPRNRYHSATYYDDATWKSGEGYKKELSGVYKKRLTYLENEALTKDVTIGTVGCTHYHPFHVHLYGHDGAAPTTSFGHITPSLRLKTGGSYLDAYSYDGCVGVAVKAQLKAGTEAYYLGWFEVAALVPVTMSPILCDIRITYFEEPQTLYRLSSSEAKK